MIATGQGSEDAESSLPAVGGRWRPPAMLALLAAVVLVGAPGASAEETEGRPSDAELLAEHRFAPDNLGYLLWDLATTEVLEARAADEPFIPASVTKIPTTVAALTVLGHDHRFSTGLYAHGPTGAGAVLGDFYLVGGGDPFLTSDHLDALVGQVVGGGIGTVTGGFYYDSSILPDIALIDPLQPYSAAYNTGVSGLALNFNVIRLDWRRTAADGLQGNLFAVTEAIELPVDAVTIGQAPAGIGSDALFWLELGPDAEHWLMSPHLPAEGSAWLPVHQPARHAALAFRRIAERHDLTLAAPVRATLPDDAILLRQHQSIALTQIVRGVLRYSNNMSAETLGMHVARTLTGEAVEPEQSAAVMADYFRQLLPGDASALRIDNHSGLSSRARTTPRQIADILQYADGRLFGDQRYADLLRAVPWVGEINQELEPDQSPVAIRAKSGTMNYARGLAGYIDSTSGRRLGFVVFVSDIAARERYDAELDPRFDAVRRSDRQWLARARALERDLVSAWALGY